MCFSLSLLICLNFLLGLIGVSFHNFFFNLKSFHGFLLDVKKVLKCFQRVSCVYNLDWTFTLWLGEDQNFSFIVNTRSQGAYAPNFVIFTQFLCCVLRMSLDLFVWNCVGCEVNRDVISIDDFSCSLSFFILFVFFFRSFLRLLCKVFFALLFELKEVFMVQEISN